MRESGDQRLRLHKGKQETVESYKTSVPMLMNTRRHTQENLNINFHNR